MQRLARLLADLDGRKFVERERAVAELERLNFAAEPALRKALADKPSLEMRRRLEALLERLDPARSPERMRELRAVEALESVGSASAKEVLRSLAGGAAKSRLTEEAKAALVRFRKP